MFFCEPMPLEATADNVQLSVFAAKASNSTQSVRPFMRTLLRLTDYLVDNGLVRTTILSGSISLCELLQLTTQRVCSTRRRS